MAPEIPRKLYITMLKADRQHTEEKGITPLEIWDEMLENEVKNFNQTEGMTLDPKEMRLQYIEKQGG